MDSYLALAKEFGGPVALAVVLLYGLVVKSGFLHWLLKAHRAVGHQAVDLRKQMTADWVETITRHETEIGRLGRELNGVRELHRSCERDLRDLEQKHVICERDLTEMRQVMAERDRVRGLLASHVIGLHEFLKSKGIEVPNTDRIAWLIAAEETGT